MEDKEALEKLDHTLCLNHNEGNLKYNIDNEDHIDCVDMNEMLDCIENLQEALEQKEKQSKILEEIRNEIKVIDYGEEYQNRYAIQYKERNQTIISELCKEDYDKWNRWLNEK